MKEYNHRFYEQEYPSIGEVVVVKITKITEIGVYVELMEYNNIEGLIMVGELSKKKIKSAASTVKINKIEGAQVIRVDVEKGYIDVSRRKVSSEDFRLCLIKYAHNKTSHNVMVTAAKYWGMNIGDLYSKYFEISRQCGSLYNYFLQVNTDIVEDEIKEFVKKKFNIAKFKVRADVEVSNQKSFLYNVEALKAVWDVDKRIEVALTRTPVFSLSITITDKEEGLSIIMKACEIVKNKVQEFGGFFHIYTEPTVFGDKGNLGLLCAKIDDLDEMSVEEELEDEDE